MSVKGATVVPDVEKVSFTWAFLHDDQWKIKRRCALSWFVLVPDTPWVSCPSCGACRQREPYHVTSYNYSRFLAQITNNMIDIELESGQLICIPWLNISLVRDNHTIDLVPVTHPWSRRTNESQDSSMEDNVGTWKEGNNDVHTLWDALFYTINTA